MDLSQNQPSEPVVSEIGLAFAVYVLYCIAYVTGGLSSVIGVIIAHAKVGDAEPMLKTHYQWQIRTFWIGLLYLVAGTILCFIVIGIFVLMWWFVGPHRQGHPRSQRPQADRPSDVVDVRLTANGESRSRLRYPLSSRRSA